MDKESNTVTKFLQFIVDINRYLRNKPGEKSLDGSEFNHMNEQQINEQQIDKQQSTANNTIPPSLLNVPIQNSQKLCTSKENIHDESTHHHFILLLAFKSQN